MMKKINFNKIKTLTSSYLNNNMNFAFQLKSFCTGSSTPKLKTIDLIKILRAETSTNYLFNINLLDSPLNHIKKSLEETNNNLEDAKIWLKKRGFKDAENRMSRSAKTKLFGLKVSNENKVVVASLSCETDFVSSTDMFRGYLNLLLDNLIQTNLPKITDEDLDTIKIKENKYDPTFNNATLLEALKHMISKTQENCKINLCEKLDYSDSKYVVGSYLHSSPDNHPALGQKAAYVVLEKIGSSVDIKELKELNHFKNCPEGLGVLSFFYQLVKELADSLAMQVVACTPKYLNKTDIPIELVEKETKIIKEGIINEGKVKEDQVDKVLNSKLNSWYEEIVLNEQNFVIVDHESSEGKSKVGDFVTKKGKLFGLKDLKIKEFKLFI